jgi:hypothetical protein
MVLKERNMSEMEAGSKEPKPWFKNKIVWIAGGLVLLIGIGSSQGGSNSGSTDQTEKMATETPEETQEPVVEETEEPVVEETEEPVVEEPVVEEPTETVSQSNAVESALSYIQYSAFSRKGLIEQLKFEDYSTADATYAVDSIDVDWNEQAAKSAANYLEYSSFSRQGLIDQLVFEGFTQSQAEYGVNTTGL